jgi:hypothetical protein
MENIFVDEQITETLVKRLRNLRNMNEEIKSLESSLKNLKSERDDYQIDLYDSMTEAQIEKLGVDGKTYYPQKIIWASIPESLREGGFNQLNKLGLESLIKMTVNTTSLSAVVRGLIKDELVRYNEETEDYEYCEEYEEDGEKKTEWKPLIMTIREDHKIGTR